MYLCVLSCVTMVLVGNIDADKFILLDAVGKETSYAYDGGKLQCVDEDGSVTDSQELKWPTEKLAMACKGNTANMAYLLCNPFEKPSPVKKICPPGEYCVIDGAKGKRACKRLDSKPMDKCALGINNTPPLPSLFGVCTPYKAVAADKFEKGLCNYYNFASEETGRQVWSLADPKFCGVFQWIGINGHRLTYEDTAFIEGETQIELSTPIDKSISCELQKRSNSPITLLSNMKPPKPITQLTITAKQVKDKHRLYCAVRNESDGSVVAEISAFLVAKPNPADIDVRISPGGLIEANLNQRVVCEAKKVPDGFVALIQWNMDTFAKELQKIPQSNTAIYTAFVSQSENVCYVALYGVTEPPFQKLVYLGKKTETVNINNPLLNPRKKLTSAERNQTITKIRKVLVGPENYSLAEAAESYVAYNVLAIITFIGFTVLIVISICLGCKICRRNRMVGARCPACNVEGSYQATAAGSATLAGSGLASKKGSKMASSNRSRGLTKNKGGTTRHMVSTGASKIHEFTVILLSSEVGNRSKDIGSTDFWKKIKKANKPLKKKSMATDKSNKTDKNKTKKKKNTVMTASNLNAIKSKKKNKKK